MKKLSPYIQNQRALQRGHDARRAAARKAEDAEKKAKAKKEKIIAAFWKDTLAKMHDMSAAYRCVDKKDIPWFWIGAIYDGKKGQYFIRCLECDKKAALRWSVRFGCREAARLYAEDWDAAVATGDWLIQDAMPCCRACSDRIVAKQSWAAHRRIEVPELRGMGAKAAVERMMDGLIAVAASPVMDLHKESLDGLRKVKEMEMAKFAPPE